MFGYGCLLGCMLALGHLEAPVERGEPELLCSEIVILY